MVKKLTHLEYAAEVSALGEKWRNGEIEREEYHDTLKALAKQRDIVKPEVKIHSVKFTKLGESEVAHGITLDHPRLGATDVRTSLVVLKAEDGSFFETLNTRY